MIDSKHWLACLDLSNMDDILIGYTEFLTSIVKPKTITFFHTVESGPTAMEFAEQFPEIESEDEFLDLIRAELNDKLKGHFEDDSIEIRMIIKTGKPTDQIIEVVNSIEPDLLLMGKKVGYAGEGIIPKRILKYVATSVLLVPENSRYSMKNILAPIDFSEQSAKAVKTAKNLTDGGNVTGQHIYRYRAQFFPYSLSEKDKKEMDQKMKNKLDGFKKDHGFEDGINYVLSLQKQERVADVVYNQAMVDQTDLIIISSKSKIMQSFVSHDFTDKMVDYAFGIPLLIQKDKEKHQKFLQSLFS
ncbi:MAG TPA: universal stress protein [Gracilimonas sp.]|uniref:universal stress protein n=1 Tax=Gracilimonas sp. TaxID=1974203 RepID=UPI002D891B18|nr:universal stress protein [Gracilimonas sp.]